MHFKNDITQQTKTIEKIRITTQAGHESSDFFLIPTPPPKKKFFLAPT